MRIQFSRPTLLPALAMFALVTTLTGFGLARRHQQRGSTTASVYTFSATPEAAIDGFIKEINAGEYGQAARYYWEAPDMWKRSPALWKSVIERPTQGNWIVRFDALDQLTTRKADAVTIGGWLHFENDGQRQGDFQLVRKPEGWIVISFS